MSIECLSAKLGLTPHPPRKRAQNERKLYKSVKSSKITLLPGAGGNAILWINDLVDIWAFLSVIQDAWPRWHVPSCDAKICSVRPVFAWVVGVLWAADPSKCPGATKQMIGAQASVRTVTSTPDPNTFE